MTTSTANRVAQRPTLAVVQTAAPDYRQPVFDELVRISGGRLRLFNGSEYFDATVKTAVRLGPNQEHVMNRFFARRRLLWQAGAFHKMLSMDAAILEFNPRILSNWAILLARRIFGRRTTLWGHAWPRQGKTFVGGFVRRLMISLSDSVVVYTERQAKELKSFVPRAEITAAPNAVFRQEEMGYAQKKGLEPGLIYVGRLVEGKKPGLLLAAFRLALPRLPAGTRLVFVGDGPMRPELERAAQGLAGVEFRGHVSDTEALRRLYGQSVASVSPGYGGLSITQSFAFGIPMVIARGEPHAPEIEAAIEGFNAVFFEEGSPNALAEAIVGVIEDRDRWQGMGPQISEDCRRRYSVEVMARCLLHACEPSLEAESVQDSAVAA